MSVILVSYTRRPCPYLLCITGAVLAYIYEYRGINTAVLVLTSTAVFFHGSYRRARSVVPRNTSLAWPLPASENLDAMGGLYMQSVDVPTLTLTCPPQTLSNRIITTNVFSLLYANKNEMR